MAGLTSTGFETKRLEDLRQDLVEKAKEEFGESVNTAANSVLGQLLDIMADRHAELWSVAQSLYSIFSPETAEGQQLDNLCALTGVSRLASTRSLVDLLVRTTPGTTIAAGSLVAVANSGVQFRAINTLTSSLDAITNARITVTVQNSTAYTITLNGTAYTYTSDASATFAEIFAGLGALINPLSGFDDLVDNGDETFTLKSTDLFTTFSLVLTANMGAAKVTSILEMEAVDSGPVAATVGTLTDILTPVSGWDDSPYDDELPATNPLEAALGSNEETDAELRDRRKISLQLAGNGTVDAIRAKLLAITGVEAVLVTENTTLVTDVNGIPGKAFEAVVLHLDDVETTEAVGQAIWDSKPAGIQAYGSDLVVVTDSQGTPQNVYYSKPTEKVAYIRVNYSLYSEEEFPSDGQATIKAEVAEAGNTLTIGNDIILQRFFGPIYANVPGISNLDIRVAVTNVGGPVPAYPGDYSTTNYAIASDEIARFDVARISTVQV
jgi:uncharacterized phage protein gp47/JayE